MITDIFAEVKAKGIPWGHHCSDLYIPVTPETTELVNDYEFKGNVTTFKSALDGERWYDIPFAYTPYITERIGARRKAKEST